MLQTITCWNPAGSEEISILKSIGSQSELFDMLGNINLRRDVLAAAERIYIFILPSYAVTYMAETLQNLYSYCTLKLRFLRIYPSTLAVPFPKKTNVYKRSPFCVKSSDKDGKDRSRIFDTMFGLLQ